MSRQQLVPLSNYNDSLDNQSACSRLVRVTSGYFFKKMENGRSAKLLAIIRFKDVLWATCITYITPKISRQKLNVWPKIIFMLWCGVVSYSMAGVVRYMVWNGIVLHCFVLHCPVLSVPDSYPVLFASCPS